MDSKQSGDPRPGEARPLYLSGTNHTSVKIIIAGSLGAGKTTLVRSVSEIEPRNTEEVMTSAGALVDDLSGIEGKNTTTVAIDFGRKTLPGDIVLYLFGTPGQQRFLTMWQDIAHGALGALVLLDTRRLEAGFEAMDRVEESGLPYAVAVNCFDGAPDYPVTVLRDHLDLHADTPLVRVDARQYTSSVDALIALLSHLIAHNALDGAR